MLRIQFAITFFLLLSVNCASQSIANDFQVVDLNGGQHSLYQYLNQGKTVILDLSTTWCSPCWDYHQTHHLENLYQAFGPEGSDDVMVFLIESDPNTGLDHLLGNSPDSMGDWTEGVSYPVIDDHTIQNAFDLFAYPTIVTICPNRQYSMSGTLTAQEHVDFIQLNCPPITIEKDVAILQFLSDTIYNCGEVFTPELDIINLNADGSNITNLEIITYLDGVEFDSFDWEGDLEPYHVEHLTLAPMVSLNGEHLVAFDIAYEEDLELTNNTFQTALTVNSPLFSSHLIRLNIYTDDHPEEISWYVKNNSTGQVILSGAPSEANLLNSNLINLGNELACFSFFIYDEGGDGNDGVAYYEIRDEALESLLVIQSEAFGQTDSQSFQVVTLTHTDSLLTPQMCVNVHPNPTSGLLNIPRCFHQKWFVFSVDGVVVLEGQGSVCDMSYLSNGVYFIHSEKCTTRIIVE